MATVNAIPEVFLLGRRRLAQSDEDDFIDVTEHRSCVAAMSSAMAWCKSREGRPWCGAAEVWCGAYCLFDDNAGGAGGVGSVDASFEHRDTLFPKAPGRYRVQMSQDEKTVTFRLVGPARPL